MDEFEELLLLELFELLELELLELLLLEFEDELELELLEEFELEFDEELELEFEDEFDDELPATRVNPSVSLVMFVLVDTGLSSGIAAAAAPAPIIAMPTSAEMVTVDLLMVSLLLCGPHIAASWKTDEARPYSTAQPAWQKVRKRRTAAGFPAAI